jgi:anaerobic ribonucleoside-triphosphate reductase activating protein
MTASMFGHATEPRSRANGPGARFVIWFQGCTLGCAGCFNPTTHVTGSAATPLADLFAQIEAARTSANPIEGITLSGGEPMQQLPAALALLQFARSRSLSTMVFSGYTIEEIRGLSGGPEVLALIDVLVDGRYRSDLRLGVGLRGSSNQRVHLLTERYQQRDIDDAPLGEVRISPDGDVVLTGVVPLKLKKH